MSRNPDRRWTPRHVALTALTSLLLVGGCAYHEGDETARSWEKWVKEHPLAGARVTDVVGTNVQPFQGKFEAYARLTVTPTEKSLEAAMRSMCRFDEVTSTPTKYFLQIERIDVEAPCSARGQAHAAAFWTATKDLTGIVQLTFTSAGIDLRADDDAISTLVPEITAAADASGLARNATSNVFDGPHVAVTQRPGRALTDELALTQGVLDAAGDEVARIEVVNGRVSAATNGSVQQARSWQESVGHGSPLLTVTPAHVVTRVPLSGTERDLVDELSTDDHVTAVSVMEKAWTLDTPSTADARSLVEALGGEPATRALGRLTLDVAATGKRKDRPCRVRPDFPEHGRADTLLALCDRADVANVDDRFDAGIDLRITDSDVRGVLRLVHQLPAGTEIALQLADNSTMELTTGDDLTVSFPQSDLGKQLVRIWSALGPLG
ncbi:MAG: hypothetical protein ACJ72D_18255 [Marmoricola sp.]